MGGEGGGVDQKIIFDHNFEIQMMALIQLFAKVCNV